MNPPTTSSKARVLIVDDSPTMRSILQKELGSDAGIEIVGTAVDAYEAKDKIIQYDPDVITLDIEMPRMDGLTFLKLIMERRPRPVIILSSLSTPASDKAMEAHKLGAFEVFAKPCGEFSLADLGPLLRQSIKEAKIKYTQKQPSATPHISTTTPARLPSINKNVCLKSILLLGASTGGTEALKDVFLQLPEHIPPILVVQHIPAHFSTAFANRLNSLCPFEVKEAEDGDGVRPDRALIAPGNFHMTLEPKGSQFVVRLNNGPKIWHQRPAVDILFKSAARLKIHTMVAAVLTGMGKDGADGLLELKHAGCRTFSQDEKSSVVYGMPRAAWEIGASEKQVPLDLMAHTLMNAIG